VGKAEPCWKVTKMLILRFSHSDGMQGELVFAFHVLEIAAIFLDLVVGTLLARKTARTGRGYIRMYYFGVTGYFFSHGLYVLASVIADLTNNMLVHDIGVFIVLSSMVMLVAAIEYAMYTRSRHHFTIAGCAALGVIMTDVIGQFTFPIMRLMVWIQFFMNPVLVLFILLNYISAARRVEGAARRNVLMIVASIALFAVGELSKFPLADLLVPNADFFGAVMMDAAIIMLYFGFMRLSIWKRDSRQLHD
jgi:hypothetical protein